MIHKKSLKLVFQSQLASVLVLGLLLGCGSNSSPAPVNPQVDAGKQTPAPESQTFDKPVETSQGAVKFSEVADRLGLKIPETVGNLQGEKFARDDSGEKLVFEYETSESLDSIKKFYDAQQLDTRIAGAELTSMGMTKTNAQIIIVGQSQGEKSKVKITGLVYPVKKN